MTPAWLHCVKRRSTARNRLNEGIDHENKIAHRNGSGSGAGPRSLRLDAPAECCARGARVAVQTAEADPNVNKYAALDLDVARKDLANAESAALHHQDADVTQSSYLAAQNARLAQAHAAAKADDARVAAGQVERDQIMLAARTREADKANLAAANSKQVADAALIQRDQANEDTVRVQAELDAPKATPKRAWSCRWVSPDNTGRAELMAPAVSGSTGAVSGRTSDPPRSN